MVTLEVLVLTAALGAGGETILLDFSADWCEPCRTMAPVVQRLEEQGFPLRRLNVDQFQRLAEQWRVGALPTFILVHEGREVERLTGPASYDRLVRMYEKAGFRLPAAATGRDAERSSPPLDPAAGSVPVNEFATAASTGAADTATAEQAAFAASVRIRVEEGNTTSFGTGTIIDVHGDEALVVTCGHLFRDSAGEGRIEVELLDPRAKQPVAGQFLDADWDDRDVALISIRPGIPVTPARVAPDKAAIVAGASVFSIGCDHGGAASVQRSRITAVDRYQGRSVYAHNIEVAGQPVDGRSGGGLFDAQGRLIGICNAADPASNEGIYAGLMSVHWQLDQLGLARVYRGSDAPAVAAVVPAALTGSPAPPPSDSVPIALPADGPATELAPADWRHDEAAPAAERANLLAALESGGEVLCVVRPPGSTQGHVLVLDAASRELLARFAREREPAAVAPVAASGGEARAAPRSAPRLLAPVAQLPVVEEQPTVRGQNRR